MGLILTIIGLNSSQSSVEDETDLSLPPAKHARLDISKERYYGDGEETLLDDDGEKAFTNTLVDAGNKGLIRVRPEIQKSHAPVIYVSERVIQRRLNAMVKHMKLRLEPQEKRGSPEVEKRCSALTSEIMGQAVQDGSHFMIRCAYTGEPLSLAPGPHSLSVEAPYRFVKTENGLGYHHVPNISPTATFLNMVKGTSTPPLLPLLAQWLKVPDHLDNGTRAMFSWIYNAQCNLATINKVFVLNESRNTLLSEWATWDSTKQIDLLELFRTGKRLQIVDGAIEPWERSSMNPILSYPGRLRSRASAYKALKPLDRLRWQEVYVQLLKIAEN